MARIQLIALALLLISVAPLFAQRPQIPVRSGPIRQTPPRGAAGGSTATERGRKLGKRQISKEKKNPANSGSSSAPSPTPPTAVGDLDKEEREPRKIGEAERKKIGRALVLSFSRDRARVRNQTVRTSLMVLDVKKGKAERLELRQWMQRDDKGVWHRLRLVDKLGDLREELLLHETPGRHLLSWKRDGGKWVRAGLDYSHEVGGTPLRLEDLLPMETGRYSWIYQGEARRLGRLVHEFKANAIGGKGASRLIVSFREADRLKVLLECGKGARKRRAKGSRAATRDGILAFERWSFEFPASGKNVVMRILTREHNRGVAASILDPEK